MKKIDWTKPLLRDRVGNVFKATYHGTTADQRTPHLISAEIAPGEVKVDLVDDYGYNCFDLQIVTNAPEPKRVYSGLWLNVYRDDNGGLSPGLHFYTSPQDAGKGTSCSRVACIRLPDFTEGEGLE